MSKHTPGPWRLMPLEEGVEYLRIRGTRLGSRYKVCNVHALFQHMGIEARESQANAHLIAAAPELLKLLNDFVVDFRVTTNDDIRAYVAEARALIAKATGEQP